jgi:3-phosphoglycerate kinase
LNKARLKNGRVHFPFDCIAAKEMKGGVETRVFDLSQGIEEGWKAFDIGPKSIGVFKETIKRANSIFWNGPVGVFEIP